MPSGGAREGAGRPRGTASELIKENQDKIKEAGVVDFLLEALEKGMVDGEALDVNKRIDIAQFLANKFMPSQKAVEMTGEGGGAVEVRVIDYSSMKVVSDE